MTSHSLGGWLAWKKTALLCGGTNATAGLVLTVAVVVAGQVLHKVDSARIRPAGLYIMEELRDAAVMLVSAE